MKCVYDVTQSYKYALYFGDAKLCISTSAKSNFKKVKMSDVGKLFFNSVNALYSYKVNELFIDVKLFNVISKMSKSHIQFDIGSWETKKCIRFRTNYESDVEEILELVKPLGARLCHVDEMKQLRNTARGNGCNHTRLQFSYSKQNSTIKYTLELVADTLLDKFEREAIKKLLKLNDNVKEEYSSRGFTVYVGYKGSKSSLQDVLDIPIQNINLMDKLKLRGLCIDYPLHTLPHLPLYDKLTKI